MRIILTCIGGMYRATVIYGDAKITLANDELSDSIPEALRKVKNLLLFDLGQTLSIAGWAHACQDARNELAKQMEADEQTRCDEIAARSD